MPSGIHDITDASGISIYPNPANTQINISLDNAIQSGSVEIYNMIGELIYQSSLNDRTMSISTAQWTDGLYAVRILTSAGMISKSFAISH
jgi:hypothetical protein